MTAVFTPTQPSPLDGEENRTHRGTENRTTPTGWITIGFPALEGRGLGEGVRG
jgi:hypothetical protein